MVFVDNEIIKADFLDLWVNNPSVVIPVWSDRHAHPLNNKLSFFYIRILGVSYIVSYNHVDCKHIDIDLSVSDQPKWVFDKSAVLHSGINIKNMYDLQANYMLEHGTVCDFKLYDLPIFKIYEENKIMDDVVSVSPISKICEYLDTLFLDVVFDFTDNWINSKAIPTLNKVEKYGLCVNENIFANRFPNAIRHIKENRIFTQYNIYTQTGRPSNRHGGINYAALDKKGITRKSFVPTDGKIFINMDYDAFHLRIIGKLINVMLPDTSVHAWFANQYGCEYDEAKKISFRMLYGGIEEKYKHVEFFRKTDDFIHSLWETAKSRGYLETHWRKLKLKNIKADTPQTLFNYFIQMIETDLNIDSIGMLLGQIADSDVELNMYTYDSFLFSVPKDNLDVVDGIKAVLERKGFPIKMTAGYDYFSL